ncbi:MAG: hypothetical protein RR527_06140, partial [Clostridia bacterium]
MKKTIAIALAFVMVFAIAATAFAGIGFGAVTTPKGPDVKVAVTLYDIGEDDAGNPMLVKHPSTKGILAGYTMAAKITVTIPAKYNPVDDQLKVTVTNVLDDDIGVDGNDLPATTLATAPVLPEFNDGASVYDAFTKDPDGKAQILDFFITLTAKETKDVKVTAVYSKAGLGDDIHREGLTITRGGKDYVVIHDGRDVHTETSAITSLAAIAGVFTVVTADRLHLVAFTTEENDGDNNYPVNGVLYLDMDEDNKYAGLYTVAIMDGVVAFQHMGTASWLYPADDGYAGLKKGFDGIMNALGFSMTSGKFGVLNDAGFEAMAGSASAVKASGTFYAYTQTLTVPGTTKVPDT